MNELRIFQVDAFADRVFAGNPAAVCPLETWLPDEVLQAIAAENNLSETAFIVAEGQGYHLRWFTPVDEVDLCGHATLATSHVLFEHLGHDGETIVFRSQSGPLKVTREASGRLVLDFPSRPPKAVPDAEVEAVTVALGAKPVEVLASARDYVAVFAEESEVLDVRPNFAAVAGLDRLGTMVTSTAADPGLDFVSRFFAPSQDIDEDPVTGSAHCTLVPFWSDRLGKSELEAAQVSARGGRLSCRLDGDRVFIGGRAVTYLEGRIRF